MAKPKIETKQEKKPFERVEQTLLEIKKIVVITDKESKFVTQIRFTLEDGQDITHSPKAKEEVKNKFRGLPTIQRSSRAIEMDEIPEKLYKWNEILNRDGVLRLMASYSIMNTQDKDGEDVSYPFLTYSDFETAYPIDENNKEIKI